MTELLPITYDNIDALAAAAYAQSRLCATALRLDVLPHLKPLDRVAPERLIDAIERRRIFTQDILVEIDALIDRLSRRIEEGTTRVERFDADECNVSAPASWTEARRTRAADELGRAVIVLLQFHETLLAVHDLMHAERAIAELRMAS